MSPANATLTFAVVLILLGVGGWVGTGMASPTALIPAGFGLVFGILGFLAGNENIRKHVMHAAAVLALLGTLGSLRGLLALPEVFAGTAERPAAVISQSVMVVVCVTLLVIYVRSFIAARKAREAGA